MHSGFCWRCVIIGMEITEACRRGRRWLLEYPEKVEVSVHHSLTSRGALRVVRVVALLALSYRYVYSILTYSSAFIMLEYLTELGFLMTWSYFALVCEDWLLNEGREKRCKQLADWIVLLFEATFCTEVVVTVLFWSVLYNYSKPFEISEFVMEVGVHGFPFLCLLADLALNAYQFPKRHMPVVFLYGMFYMTVNLAYSLEVKPVYKPIDWVSPMCYLFVALSVALLLAVHILVRKHWQKYRRPRLVEQLNGHTENYFNVDMNTLK